MVESCQRISNQEDNYIFHESLYPDEVDSMVNIGGLGGIISGGLNSPGGKEQVIKFLTSPEGMAMIQQFIGSPEGKPLAGKLLMPILGSLGVPETVSQPLQQYIT